MALPDASTSKREDFGYTTFERQTIFCMGRINKACIKPQSLSHSYVKANKYITPFHSHSLPSERQHAYVYIEKIEDKISQM